jgi:AP-3 complex subunit delta-1
MTVLSFADSGRGISNFTLEAVAKKAIELGFEKEGSQSLNKKPAQRADLQGFFKAYGVKAFSPFRDKFEKEKLLPPEEYLAQKEAQELAAKECEFAPVTEEEYNEATQTADELEKKWRLFKKCVACLPYSTSQVLHNIR